MTRCPLCSAFDCATQAPPPTSSLGSLKTGLRPAPVLSMAVLLHSLSPPTPGPRLPRVWPTATATVVAAVAAAAATRRVPDPPHPQPGCRGEGRRAGAAGGRADGGLAAGRGQVTCRRVWVGAYSRAPCYCAVRPVPCYRVSSVSSLPQISRERMTGCGDRRQQAEPEARSGG